MTAQAAACLLRWWTRVYTVALPAEARERRRAEVEADLWESLRDPVRSRQIVARLLLGVADDVGWSIASMDPALRSSMWWSAGSLVTFLLAAGVLLYAPDSAVMREALWGWPTATVLHAVGFTALIGLRSFVDLRLIGLGWPFGSTSVQTLARRLAPWIAIAALLTLASGLALYAVAPQDLAASSTFRIKIAALALVLLNSWYCHAVLLRDATRWDSGRATTAAGRASGYLSLALWLALLASSLLVPYTP